MCPPGHYHNASCMRMRAPQHVGSTVNEGQATRMWVVPALEILFKV